MLRHFLIIFCSKKANKYNVLLDMLKEGKGFNRIYAVGLMAVKRDKWLIRVENLKPKR